MTKKRMMIGTILERFANGEQISSKDLMILIGSNGGPNGSGSFLHTIENYLEKRNEPLIIAYENEKPIQMKWREDEYVYAYMMTPEQVFAFLEDKPKAAGRKATYEQLKNVYNSVDRDLIVLTNVAFGFTSGNLDECQQSLMTMLVKYAGNIDVTLQISDALVSIERRKNVFTFTEEDIVSKIKDCLLERDYDFELVETLTINSFRFYLGNTKHGVYVIDEDGSWTFELTNDDLLNDVLIEDEDGFLFSKGFIDLLDLDALYNSLQTYNNLTQKPRFWF